MNKLRLKLETLQVESFDTGLGSARQGTVHGQSYWETTHLTVCPVVCGGGGDPPASQTCQNTVCCQATPNTNCEM